MRDGKMQAGNGTAEMDDGPMPKRALDWTMRIWRPAGTVVAVGLALLLTWHVINGENGLNAWHYKRAEDHRLQWEIKDLEQENARLRDRIERLKSDPEAVGMLAREKLHYVKSNEVIATLAPQEQTQTQPAGAGK
ncbi:MAG: septum formation initiator family protein [Terracidiphilus sp.]